jgi:hypothetical protein
MCFALMSARTMIMQVRVAVNGTSRLEISPVLSVR